MKGTGKIWIFYDGVTRRQTKPMGTLQAQMTLLNLKVKDPKRFFLWTPGWTDWVPLNRFLASDQTYFVITPAPSPSGMPPAPTNIEDDRTVKIKSTASEETITLVFDQAGPGEEAYTTILEDSVNRSDNGYFQDDFSAEKIDPDAKHTLQFNLPQKKKPSASDRREAARHHFKIEVILINKNGRSFRTFSQNISMGGTLLSDDLPKDFVNTQFDLILVNKFEKDPARGRLHFQGRVVGDYVNPRRLMFLDPDDHTRQRLESMLRSYVARQKEMTKKKSS